MSGFNKFMNKFISVVTRTATELTKESRLTSNLEFHKVLSNLVGGEGFFGKISYGFIEVHRCLARLEQIEIFLKNYKDCVAFRRKGITNSVHLRYHVEKYLEEMYILKERLIAYSNILRKHYKDNPSGVKGLKTLEESVNRALGGIIEIRGLHVHQNRFIDEDINRLETYDLLLILKRSGMPPEFEKFVKIECNRVTKMWKDRVKSNNRAVRKLVDIYFTKVQTLIFDERGQIRTGNKIGSK